MQDDVRPIPPELLNPSSGRLDSLRIASYLYIEIKQVAIITGSTEQLIRDEPDAPSIQEPLRKVALIISGLLELTGGDKRSVLIWLKALHPVLDDESPLNLMMSGKINVVVDLVDDLLAGAPA